MRDAVADIADRIAARAGLRPPAWVVEARAGERAKARGVRLGDYRKLLDGDAGELDALVEMLRVGETRFFRHAEQIEALRRKLIPALARRRPAGETVRAWSAGCATGEEAWTLAMLLADGLPDRDVRVLGSDLSEEALARARAGRYRAEAVADLEPGLRRRWFVRRGRAEVEVAPALRERVTFERRNLVEGAAAGERWDLVLCRNVLMYFDAATQRRVVDRLAASLVDDGFLVVGYAEHGAVRDVPSLSQLPGALAAYSRSAPVGPSVAKVARKSPAARRKASTALPPPVLQTPRARPADGPAIVRVDGMATAAEVAIAVRAALAAGGELVVELDGARHLDDDIATVLRRALAAARASGIATKLVATRPGPRRWLARHHLESA